MKHRHIVVITVLSMLALTAMFVTLPTMGQTRGDRNSGGGLAGGGGGGAEGTEPFSMEVVSRWGGPVNDVEVVGNIAYIGSGSRFVVLDVTDPANITEIGSLDLIAPITGIEIQGSMALVITATDGPTSCQPYLPFCRVNISNPGQPTLDSYEEVPGVMSLQRVAAFRTTAYVTSNGGVHMFDLSGVQVNYVGPPTFGGDDIHVDGHHLFLIQRFPSNGALKLKVYDLLPNPAQPVLVGEVQYGDGSFKAYRIDASNGIAAVSGEQNDPNGKRSIVFFFDISNPSQPVLLSQFDQFGALGAYFPNVIGVALFGHYALVTQPAIGGDSPVPFEWRTAKGLVVLDISNPAQPVEVKSFKTHAAVFDVRMFGNRAYLMDEGEGLIVFDMTQPASPQRLGSYHSPGHIRDMVKVGTQLYIADKWDGFTILDVSNPPMTPHIVGNYQSPLLSPTENARIDNTAIVVHGQYAFLMSSWYSIQVVNVSDPTAPQLVNEVRHTPLAISGGWQLRGFKMQMTGSVLHCTYQLYCPTSCFQQPTDCSCGSGAPSFWILRSFDASNPRNMVEIATSILPGGPSYSTTPKDLVLDGHGRAFGATMFGVHCVDLDAGGNPPFSSPSQLLAGVSGQWIGVDVEESILFLVNDNPLVPAGGFYTFDVSNPAIPVQLAHVGFDSSGISMPWAWDVTVENNHAYVLGLARPNADCPSYSHSCLMMFDVADPSMPTLLNYVPVSSGGLSQPLDYSHRGVLLVDEPYIYVGGGRTGDYTAVHDGLSIIRINGLPSDCPADINNDSTVNVTDLLAVISSWGPCTSPPCAADINGDNVINVTDLLAVISNWGTCD